MTASRIFTPPCRQSPRRQATREREHVCSSGQQECVVSLRQACEGAEAPATALEVRWPSLSKTARSIATKWADRPVRTPPPFQLDVIVNRIRDEWRERRDLLGLPSREARWLPHAIFHPEPDRQAWLAR